MVSNTWFERIRSTDVRILAAIAAALMLIAGPRAGKFNLEALKTGAAKAVG